MESVEPDVIETIRLEHGIPVWDAELTPTTLPPEAGPVMISALTYTKGCYVGQETISRLKSVGHVNRTLVFLRSDSAEFPPRTTLLVTQDGREVGAVTSSGYSPHFSAGIALGYVQRTVAEKNLALKAGSIQLNFAAPLPFPI
jgi:folate-binding protein YgfZ